MRRLQLVAAVSLLALSSVAGAKDTTSEDMTGRKERQMAHCPSAVPDAKTIVEDTKSGVILTVTASEPSASERIRMRAHDQEKMGRLPGRGALEHTGGGTGSGKYGFCPGMIEGTRVAVDDLPDGARLTVRAASESQVRGLQKMTHERARQLSAKH
jgi:TusA-related sulfurtransferase